MRSSSILAAMGSLALVHCSVNAPTNGAAEVGNACTPSLENNFRFGGFRVKETTVESGALECGGGVCLVNHFQGRVSCPLGQPAPKDANGLDACSPEYGSSGQALVAQGSCSVGQVCVAAGSLSPACDPSDQEAGNNECLNKNAGGKCNPQGFCECETSADCAGVTTQVVACDATTRKCLTYACHKQGDCQTAGASASQNAGKACCVPGTDTPVAEAICGGCTGTENDSPRSAANSVYCTCRCGVADGAEAEPDFDFCTCGDGFECTEILPELGLSDPGTSGKYCIRAGTAYNSTEDQCGFVDGYWSTGSLGCDGAPTNQCLISGGPCNN